MPVLLLACAGWALRDFLGPGLPVEFDAHSHLARAGFVSRALVEGHLPRFGFEWYGGFRLLEFYSPGWYVLVAALGAILGDPVAATKAVLWAVQCLTTLCFYAFARRLALAPLPAALAALLFLASPQRGWVLGVVGNQPNALVYAGAAGFLWVVARGAAPNATTARLVAARSLLLAFMVLGHFQAILLFPALLAFDLVRLSETAGVRRALAILSGSLAGLAGLVAFVALPMVLDLPIVSLSLDIAGAGMTRPGLHALAAASGLQPILWEHLYVRDHGVVWVALALAGAGLALVRRSPFGRALAAGLAGSALGTLLFGDRAVLALALFLAPLCARLVADVADLVRSLRPGWAPVVEGALALAATAFLWIHPPGGERYGARWAPPDALGIYLELPATATRSRSFDVTPRSLCLDGFYGSSSAAPLVSGRAVPFGAFPQGAPVAVNLSMALLGRLASELEDGSRLSEESLDALYLSHVQLLVDRSPEPRLERLEAPAGSVEEQQARRLLLRHASPALFAPRLEPLPADAAPEAGPGREPRLLAVLRSRWRDDRLTESTADPSLAPLARTGRKRDWEALEPVVRAMQIDRRRGVAARLFVDAREASVPNRHDAVSAEPGAFQVIDHEETAAVVRVDAHAEAPGFVRLAYAFDPTLELRLDGEPVVAGPDSLGAIVIDFPAGRHEIVMRPILPVRDLTLLVASGALALALIAVLLRGRRSA